MAISPFENGQGYNNPVDLNDGKPVVASDIGEQTRTDHWVKKSLIEARKLQFFTPLADVTGMPKNMGKKIKKYHYLPLLDLDNVNSQGIDAAGKVILKETYSAFDADGVEITNGTDWVTATDVTAGHYPDKATAEAAAGSTGSISQNGGNLYGSSKDPGTITGKMPVLSANGGRVNRVGFTRKLVEGSLEKFGFFDEYNQESLDFDSDADLLQHVNREMINGATEMSEDALQIDLLNVAEATTRWPGTAANMGEIVGNTSDDFVSYRDLLQLSILLDQNRTPKQTKVLTGTRFVDTRTIAGGRVMYIGAELQPLLEGMTDLHSKQAFIPVHQYAAGTTTLNGEIGTIGHFRLVVVPEMMIYSGKGGDATGGDDCYETNERYDVFPMLVVGDGAFSTIGFQTDGKTVKFKITHKKPGVDTADRNDPFGETGFMSIKWYYGFLEQRPERIGRILTAAPM